MVLFSQSEEEERAGQPIRGGRRELYSQTKDGERDVQPIRGGRESCTANQRRERELFSQSEKGERTVQPIKGWRESCSANQRRERERGVDTAMMSSFLFCCCFGMGCKKRGEE